MGEKSYTVGYAEMIASSTLLETFLTLSRSSVRTKEY
jgi:hypothetical protein